MPFENKGRTRLLVTSEGIASSPLFLKVKS